MKASPLTLVIALILTGLLAGGCMSTRMTFEGRPKVTLPAKVARQYTVEKVEFVCEDCRREPAGWRNSGECMHTFQSWRKDGFGEQLRQRAEQRHPRLFSHARTAIPITVRATYDNENHMGVAFVVEILTLTACGAVFPSWPAEMDYTVRLAILDPEGHPVQDAACTAKLVQWVSLFTPFALINVPGPSEVPKSSSCILNATSEDKLFSDYIMDALADTLAAELLKLDPAKLRATSSVPTTVPMETVTPDTVTLPNF